MPIAGLTTVTQFLTFHLEQEVFAIDISKIKEVLEFSEVTRIPRTPDFMCGVINLRGSVVPVVDLRAKFAMPRGEKTVNTCIIIIDVIQDDEATVIGAMVDSVKEVMELDPNQIEPAPRIGTGLRSDFVRGMGKQGQQFVILLDTDRLFSHEELSMLQDAGIKGGTKSPQAEKAA
ncbi:MAG: purine-binding chemotaxis protein CheW [Magnetococcales bacterium]|nr:purine-binding chemotaxis protein CheW [Magnetococcales bacterium]MBF0262590.1 purine-binding chemotaxis protein CheW [Magnetococcales bacterium]